MTEQELQTEWTHAYETRLGVLCEDREPDAEQKKMATDEADAHIRKLRLQS